MFLLFSFDERDDSLQVRLHLVDYALSHLRADVLELPLFDFSGLSLHVHDVMLVRAFTFENALVVVSSPSNTVVLDPLSFDEHHLQLLLLAG